MDNLRKRYRRHVMYQIVMSYIRSNQSQEEFCRSNNITICKLQYWYRQYKNEVQPDDMLVPVDVEDVPVFKSAEEVKIKFPNGMIVEVMSSEPVSLIRSLLSQT